MPFQVPNAVNYPSPLNAVPSRWASDPVEGPKIINCEVDWGTMGGAEKTLNFNLQNNATLNFSQIVALAIDNSACGADLQFSFPDTETTISIPAYAPYSIVPVFSNQTMFYLSSPNAESEDVTRFGILNSLPPPIAVPTTQEQDVAAISSNNISTSPAITQLIPASVSGTLEAAQINYSLFNNGSSVGFLNWNLKDGAGNPIAIGSINVLGSSFNDGVAIGTAFSMSDLRVRFQNGITLDTTSEFLNNNSSISTNLYYRTP